MEGSRRVKVPTDLPLRFAAFRASIRKPSKYVLFPEDTADKVTVSRKDQAQVLNNLTAFTSKPLLAKTKCQNNGKI